MNTTIQEISDQMQQATVASLQRDSRYRDFVNSIADGTCKISTEDMAVEAAKYGYTLPVFQQHVSRAMRRKQAEQDVLRAEELLVEANQLKAELCGLHTTPVGPLDADVKQRGMTMAGKQLTRSRLRREELTLRQRGMHILQNTAAEGSDYTDWRNFNLALPAVPVGFEGLPTY